jgi:dTMP kinase
VICDRYLDSSLAYQGIARGLGVEEVLEMNVPAIRGLLPDRTILLLVDREESLRRVGEARDRIEREDDDFRAQVDRAYRELAELYPDRIVAVDGSQAPEQISKEILEHVRQLS